MKKQTMIELSDRAYLVCKITPCDECEFSFHRNCENLMLIKCMEREGLIKEDENNS